LPVERLDGRGVREAGGEGGGAELGCAAAWRQDGADGDVFDEGGVEGGALEEGAEGAVEEVGGCGVFEAAFAALCDGGSESAGYDDLELLCQMMLRCLGGDVRMRLSRHVMLDRCSHGERSCSANGLLQAVLMKARLDHQRTSSGFF